MQLAVWQLSCNCHRTTQKGIGSLGDRLTAVTEVTSRTIASRYPEILDRRRFEGKVHEEAVD